MCRVTTTIWACGHKDTVTAITPWDRLCTTISDGESIYPQGHVITTEEISETDMCSGCLLAEARKREMGKKERERRGWRGGRGEGWRSELERQWRNEVRGDFPGSFSPRGPVRRMGPAMPFVAGKRRGFPTPKKIPPQDIPARPVPLLEPSSVVGEADAEVEVAPVVPPVLGEDTPVVAGVTVEPDVTPVLAEDTPTVEPAPAVEEPAPMVAPEIQLPLHLQRHRGSRFWYVDCGFDGDV